MKLHLNSYKKNDRAKIQYVIYLEKEEIRDWYETTMLSLRHKKISPKDIGMTQLKLLHKLTGSLIIKEAIEDWMETIPVYTDPSTKPDTTVMENYW